MSLADDVARVFDDLAIERRFTAKIEIGGPDSRMEHSAGRIEPALDRSALVRLRKATEYIVGGQGDIRREFAPANALFHGGSRFVRFHATGHCHRR